MFFFFLFLQCFINCILQCLSNTQPLLDICINAEKCQNELSRSAGNTDGRLVHGTDQQFSLSVDLSFVSPACL
jgi:ubiquitin C-terminal hydrolase